MPLKDDGCIIRAVGFVAIYSANLEESLANLVNKAKEFIEFNKEIEKYHLSDQAKHLRNILKAQYENCPNFHTKKRDQKRVDIVLKEIEKIAKKRNQILHSSIISTKDGDVQNNPKSGSKKPIKSAYIYNVANEISNVDGGVEELKLCLYRLFNKL